MMGKKMEARSGELILNMFQICNVYRGMVRNILSLRERSTGV